MGLELLIIAAMLLLNSLFAAYELGLASISLSRLKVLADQKVAGAQAALAMKSRMEASLAVVQLGITLVGAIAAAVGGAEANESMAPWFQAHWGLSETWAELLALAVFVIPLSAVTIIVGELIPKVFAIKNPQRVCLALSPVMRIFASVVFPAVWLFELVTKAVLAVVERRLPADPNAEPPTGLNELRAQVNLLRATRVIGVQEEKIMLGASKLSSQRVRDIMLPADDIVTLFADATLGEALIAAHLDAHTRFPVTEKRGDPQGIVGYVNFKELVFLAKTHPEHPSLREITRPLAKLAPDITVSDALRQMVAEHLHLALVRDAGGTVMGMITMEDIFEELVGDIQDEFDRLPRQLTPSGRQWVMGGGTTLARIRQVLDRPDLGIGLPPETTVNDWLYAGRDDHYRGGDVVKKDGFSVLVRKVRRHKVLEALLEPDTSKPIPTGPELATMAASELPPQSLTDIGPPGTP